MNPFLRGVEEEGEAEIFLPRLYGRVEQFELDKTSVHYLFDTVGADFFDGAEKAPWDRTWFDQSPLRALELTTSGSDNEIYEAVWEDLHPELAQERESPWLEIELDGMPVANSRPAKLYDSLVNEGKEVFVTSIAKAPENVQKKLDDTFNLDDFSDASDRDLDTILSAGVPDYVAVYDVGQGNCNAIWSSAGGMDCVAKLYYDFGGGILQNASTFPAALKRWCFTAHPSVVLSHWDWDHWSSQARDPRVRNMMWLAPRQAIGPTHAAFAASLSNLRIWPAALQSHTNGALTIEQCTGAGRNHSGLALIIRHDGQAMLLPGDARYTAIPSASPAAFTCVVVPHHGADMHSAYVPSCMTAQSNARVAYSFGAGNSFLHPRAITKTHHHAAGWQHDPPGPPPAITLTTDVRTKHCGHISLHWISQSAPPPLPCTRNGRQRSCDLEIEQV